MLAFRLCRNVHIAREDDAPEWESFQGTVFLRNAAVNRNNLVPRSHLVMKPGAESRQKNRTS